MPQTANKGYEVQVTGSNSGTWGTTLNDDVISIIDNNLGSVTTKSLTNVNVTLSATESESLILRLTGTLTGNVQITTSCVGMTICENLTTGNFSVTFTNGVGSVVLPQSARALVILDGTNGARIAADIFPSGTKMIFTQSSPPTGWTIDAAQNNAALRIVSSGGGGTGGSADFTSAFSSQTPGGTVGNTSLTTDQLPSHQHFVANTDSVTFASGLNASTYVGANGILPGGNNNQYGLGGSSTVASVGLTSSTGTGSAHTHSFTGNAMNLAVKYRDCVIGTKN